MARVHRLPQDGKRQTLHWSARAGEMSPTPCKVTLRIFQTAKDYLNLIAEQQPENGSPTFIRYDATALLYDTDDEGYSLDNGSDDELGRAASHLNLEDAGDSSDWGPYYLEFVAATRTCAARRVAAGLPPAPCSRYHACNTCLALPGANAPSGYWLFMSEAEVEQRLVDGRYYDALATPSPRALDDTEVSRARTVIPGAS